MVEVRGFVEISPDWCCRVVGGNDKSVRKFKANGSIRSKGSRRERESKREVTIN